MFFGDTIPHESCCDGGMWQTYIKSVHLSQHFFQIDKSEEQNLVHVSYPHTFLESRPKIKNSCWMEQGKTFCTISVIDTQREKIPGFESKKKLNKNLLIDFYISNMFFYLTSCLLQSIFKKILAYILNFFWKRIPRKTRFFVLARPSYSVKRKSAQHFFMKLKFIKMNSWMS